MLQKDEANQSFSSNSITSSFEPKLSWALLETLSCTMASPVSNGQASQIVVRQTAAFKQSIWGDRFLNYKFDKWKNHALMKEIEELKKGVKKMLSKTPSDSLNQLKVIDDIQRLGVEHHFTREIEDDLECIYAAYLDQDLQDNVSLHHVSLRFRLLRQQGLNISCDTLDPFRDGNRKFKELLATDVEGLLSLYEASFLGLQEETLLDEALVFSTTHLEVLSKQQIYPLSDMISRALDCPLWKRIVRVNAAHYISIYKELPSHNEILLRFAKLDYNLLQSLHKKELSDLSKWRRGLDFARKLPFTRDRIVECCYWTFLAQVEPQYSLSRRITSKIIYLTTVIDDIYDAYGTFQELTVFTSAIKRWSDDRMSELPDYMQICYQALLAFFQEIEEDMIKQGTSYRFSYTKEAMIKQIESYYEEAKWLDKKYMPTFDEYISVASKSFGYALLLTIAFAGMSSGAAKKDDFDWLVSEPKFLKAVELICRLLDDLVSSKLEKQRGHIPTSVECYTNQYKVSEEEAIIALKKKISDSWKDLNKETMKPTAVSRPLLILILHLVRAVEELYKEEDAYTNNGKRLQNGISAMFGDAFSL